MRARRRSVGWHTLTPTLARTRTPDPAVARAPRPSPRPSLTPGTYIHQGDFLKEADEDVGKMAEVLEAAPANLHMSIQQARPATATHADTRRARWHTRQQQHPPRWSCEPRPAARPPHPPPTHSSPSLTDRAHAHN